MLRCGTALAISLALATLGITTPASATDCHPASGLSTCIDGDNLWSHPGGGPFLSIGSATTTPEDQVSFGVVVSYLSRPISARVPSPDPNGTAIHVIDNVFDATLLWTLGLTDRLEFTTAAPVTLYQTGAGLADLQGTSAQLARSVMRDARFGLAFSILPRPRIGNTDGTALVARFEFSVPTGDSSSFAGTDGLTAWPTLVLNHRVSRLEIAAEIGARIRSASEFAGASVGTQLSGALGATFDVIPRRRLLSVGAEAFALYTLPRTLETGPNAGQTSAAVVPAEWMATVSSAPFLAGDLSFTGAGGGTIPLTSDSSLTSPRFRFSVGIRYAPLGRDFDGDGVLDRNDKCRTQPEDRDGFEDQDGCPDPDNDKDGIPDDRDHCRDEPEDFDGFQDQDGCPDLDDDKDGIPDDKDQCRSAAEDKDGFQDEDGCPDLDNDKDGVLDSKDRCPNLPEDLDGFQDQDGCPDPDNDKDGIADAKDLCPREAEDKDGFEDQDGCPEPDNDKDGVLDAKDRCPKDAETINGVEDEDGCPEPGAKSLVSWDGERVVFVSPHRFAPGQTTLTPELVEDLRMAAALSRTHAPLEAMFVEGYGDRSGDDSERAVTLGARRAEVAKAALVAAGLPADKITAAAGDLAAKRSASAPSLDITVRGRPAPKSKSAAKHAGGAP